MELGPSSEVSLWYAKHSSLWEGYHLGLPVLFISPKPFSKVEQIS